MALGTKLGTKLTMKFYLIRILLSFTIFFTKFAYSQNNAPSISPSGTRILCPNSTITLSIQSQNSDSVFIWLKNNVKLIDSTRNITISAIGDYTAFILRGNDTIKLNTVLVQSGEAPAASFTFNPTSTCGISTINFTNTSTGAVSYRWNFGNNKSSDETNPKHRFRPNAGTSSDTY